MGGFHGGHSGGGGGFHGGHSGGSFHGGGGYRHHTTIFVGGTGGMRPIERKPNPTAFVSFLTASIILGIIGLILFFMMATPNKATAVVTNAYTQTDYYGEEYEIYDFKYEYDGETYTGYGDDDLASDGSYTILVGEEYTVYLHIGNPNSYSFEDSTNIAVGALLIFEGLAAGFLVGFILKLRKYRIRLKEVGDANGDGVVNAADIVYADKKNDGKSDGVYEGAKKATAENTYNEMKKDPRKICPYCGSYVNDDVSFCPNCGGRVTEEKKD